MSTEDSRKRYVGFYDTMDNFMNMHPHMITWCIVKGFLEPVVSDTDIDIVELDLTLLGEAWLGVQRGIQVTEDGGKPDNYIYTPEDFFGMGERDVHADHAETTSQAASEATGYTVHTYTDSTGEHSFIKRDNTEVDSESRYLDTDTQEYIARLLNAETSALREQNARLQQELDSARARVSVLETQVNTATGEAAQRGERIMDLKEAIQNAYKALASNGTNADKVHNAFSWLRDYATE